MKKAFKMLATLILFIFVSLILLGYSGVGNLATDTSKNGKFIKIGDEEIRYILKSASNILGKFIHIS